MTLCHLRHRALIRLSGPDIRDFLQGQLTQDMVMLTPARPVYAGLLTPQGKAIAELFLFAEGADILIDVAAERLEAVSRRLMMMRLRRPITIAPEPSLGVFARWGSGVGLPADPRLPAAGSRELLPAETAAEATLADWHRHRLLLGLPEADEIGAEELLWLETNARELHGVSFTKGCYTGQENTARMHHRDKLRKRLLPLELAADAPADGPVMAGDVEAATLRGIRHGRLQMALVRMEYASAALTMGKTAVRLLRPDWLPAMCQLQIR